MKFDKKSIGELCILILSIIIIVVCFIFSAEKNYVSLVASIIGVASVYCFSVGLFYAPIVSIVYSLFYIYLSYTQRYFGEIIAFVAMIIPMRVVSVVSWVKGKKHSQTNKVHSNQISKKEILILFLIMIVATVGIFFVLQAFNTAEIWIGTFSLVTNVVASYLILRRNKYMFAVQIINDMTQISMWTISVVKFGISYLPTLLAFSTYLILDIYGLINWILNERAQKKLNQNKKLEEDASKLKDETLV